MFALDPAGPSFHPATVFGLPKVVSLFFELIPVSLALKNSVSMGLPFLRRP